MGEDGEFLCRIKGELKYNKLPCTTGEESSRGWEAGELEILRLVNQGLVEFHCVLNHKKGASFVSKTVSY